MDDGDPQAFGGLIELLTGFLDDAGEITDEGVAFVERMRLQVPLELYVRPGGSGGGEGEDVAVDGCTALRTETTFAPVLHRLTLHVEVDGAAELEQGLES